MDAARLARIDSVVLDAVQKGDVPGAVVGVVRGDNIVYLKALGYKSTVPDTVALTEDTLFDLASVSKCVGTTLSFLQLVEQGFVRLTDPVSRYIPGFLPWTDPDTGEPDAITIQDLLTHSSGLDPYVDVSAFVRRYGENTPDSLLQFIATQAGRHFKPGTDVLYSCLNFVTLQHVLQKVTGERLCDYAQHHVFDALGLRHTCYFPLAGTAPSCPAADRLAPLCAPTEVQDDGLPLVAAVHDPLARLINAGNAGNAGVFSTAGDLCVMAAAILGGGAVHGMRILGPETVRLMLTIPADNDPRVARALGWDTYARYPGTSGDIFPREHTVGHTGYTGPSLLIDPDTQTAVVILCHRVHPADKGSTARLRAVIANIVAGAITGSAAGC